MFGPNTWPNSARLRDKSLRVPLRDISLTQFEIRVTLTVTFQVHESHAIAPMDSPYVISYWFPISYLIVTHWSNSVPLRDLSLRVPLQHISFEIGVTLTVTFQVHDSQMLLHQWTPIHTFL